MKLITSSLLEEVTGILRKRDSAVKSKDREAFSSTQFKEIAGSSVSGYLATDKLTSKLLCVQQDESEEKLIVAFVKEEYWKDGQVSHNGYLLYFLQRSDEGELKIMNIVWR